jgi:predicted TIM-barrel fold metal-dependent hydrolase
MTRQPFDRRWSRAAGFVLRLGVAAVTLAIWAALGIGANFGVHPVLATAGLLWLATIGLPTSLGVVLAATIWGRFEPLTGFYGFLWLAAGLGIAFQVITFRLLAGVGGAVRAVGGVLGWGQVSAGAGVVLVVVGMVLWLTHRPPASLSGVIDAHAHLFGDEGWPPVHKQTCGLSSAQKANSSYGLLTKLLRIPPTGDLNELYVEALVRQAREARDVLGSFRVVLLAQDCRYNGAGDPDWVNTSVYVPNEHLFRVVARYPDLFIPCPSINPQRKDWEAELDDCLAQGARVLKIHPPTQAVNPGDPKFRAFYRKCAEKGMRIMVHTGAEHSAPIASKTLGDPRFLELALEEGCLVIAAHTGTRAFFNPPAEDHFPDFVALAAKHARLYADTAVLGSQFRWRCIPEIVSTPAVLPRMIHASDWPFPANAMVFWHRLHPFTVVSLMAEQNLFVRDLRLKLALGMPAESFARIGALLPVKAAAQ